MRLILVGALAVAGAVALSGCGKQGGPPPKMPPQQVGVLTIAEQPVPLVSVLPGRTSPFAVSEVRPQVSGLILKRLFVEGSSVKAGQVLFTGTLIRKDKPKGLVLPVKGVKQLKLIVEADTPFNGNYVTLADARVQK